jgi:hypothetical protein
MESVDKLLNEADGDGAELFPVVVMLCVSLKI